MPGHSGIRSVGPCYSAAGDDLNKGGGSWEFLIFSLIRASLDLWEEGVRGGRGGRFFGCGVDTAPGGK